MAQEQKAKTNSDDSKFFVEEDTGSKKQNRSETPAEKIVVSKKTKKKGFRAFWVFAVGFSIVSIATAGVIAFMDTLFMSIWLGVFLLGAVLIPMYLLGLLISLATAIKRAIKKWPYAGFAILFGVNLLIGILGVIVWRTKDEIIFGLSRHAKEELAQNIIENPEDYELYSWGCGFVEVDSSFISVTKDVYVCNRNNRTVVFYYTFAGIPDGASGYVYTSDGEPPTSDELPEGIMSLEKVRDNWFDVSVD